MIKILIDRIRENKWNIYGLKFDKVTDYLSISDQEILCCRTEQPELNRVLEEIRNRELFKRILEICPSTIKDFKNHVGDWKKFKEDLESNLNKVRDDYITELNSSGIACNKYEIVVDMPKTPELLDFLPEVIIPNEEPLGYLEIFDAQEFFKEYFSGPSDDKQIKLKIYIFGKSDNTFREKCSKKLGEYIKKKYNLDLKPSAFSKIVR